MLQILENEKLIKLLCNRIPISLTVIDLLSFYNRVKYVFGPYILRDFENSPYISINVFKIPTFFLR